MGLSINRAAMVVGTVIILLVMLCGAAGMWSIRTLSDAIVQESAAAALQRNHQTADMMHDAIRSDVLAALGSGAGLGTSLEEARSDLESHIALLNDMIAQNQKYRGDPAVETALAGVRDPLAAYAESARGIVTLAASDPAAASARMGDFRNAFSVLEESMEKATEVIANRMETTEREAQERGRQCWLIMSIALAGSVLAALLAVYAVRTRLVRPLLALNDTMRELANENFSVVVPGADRKDELGAMAASVLNFQAAGLERKRLEEELNGEARQGQQRMIDELGNALQALADGDLARDLERPFPAEYEALRVNFNNARRGLAAVIEQVLSGTDSIKSGSSEISAASDDLARRTEQQAASLEETAAAMDRITETVRDTARHASTADRLVGEASGNAGEGGRVVREAVTAMDGIERSSREISEIINVIDGIAFQTNLLALNAGVEAARAGDAGKGFAVVANEVRALAQRSADAARHIKELILDSSRQVENGVQLVGQTGQALDRIVSSIGEISTLVGQISESAASQAEGLQHINVAIAEMDKTTQQNAAMVEQSTAAAHSLANEAESFVQIVSRFQISAGARSTRPMAAPARMPASARAASPSPAARGNLALASLPDPDDDWAEF